MISSPFLIYSASFFSNPLRCLALLSLSKSIPVPHLPPTRPTRALSPACPSPSSALWYTDDVLLALLFRRDGVGIRGVVSFSFSSFSLSSSSVSLSLEGGVFSGGEGGEARLEVVDGVNGVGVFDWSDEVEDEGEGEAGRRVGWVPGVGRVRGWRQREERWWRHIFCWGVVPMEGVG